MGLIDTAAFIEKVKLAEKAGEETKGIYTTVDYLINEYGELVEAEPVRHGQWIGISDGDADGYPVFDEWECSECGVVFEDEKPHYKYCPNCGARMDGE